tara:strand:+ start:7223 stop:8521 length:1299 start_codon:yes stop_codon:yes gene_type:complete
MAFVLKDRVKETTTTTGTGPVVLAGEAGGFQDFSSAIGNTNTTYYAIVHQSLDEWEVGIGTYGSASNNLTRNTVLSSSTGSSINFSAGTKDVFVTLPASQVVHTSASPSFTNVSISGNLTVGGTVTVTSSATFKNHVSSSTLAVTGITSIGGSLVGTSATFGDKVSVSALAVTGITSIGGSLVGTSATFGNHVSASTLAVTGITSIGGSLVGTSATFGDKVSVSALAVTGITSIGGSLVGTSATFSNHVSVNSLAITANVTAAQFYGGGANLTGVSAGIATNVSGGYAVLTSAQISGNVSIGGATYLNSTLGVGVASPLGQIHISKNAIATVTSLTDATNVSVGFANSQNFSLTLTDNRTLSNPTNCVTGQVGSIFIIQDGTGGRTLSYGTNWEFPAGTAPTLSTSAAAVDRLDYIVRTSTAIQANVSKEYS